MAEAASQRDADDSVDRLITEAASLYAYANLKDEQKKVLKLFVEGKDVFVALFNSLACFSWTDSLSISLKHDLASCTHILLETQSAHPVVICWLQLRAMSVKIIRQTSLEDKERLFFLSASTSESTPHALQTLIVLDRC